MIKQTFQTIALIALFTGSVIAVSAAEVAKDGPKLNAHLEPLRPFLKTWKGTFVKSTPDKPIVDVLRCERGLNGQAIRFLHSINDGAYGGETMIIWDEKKQSLVYYYFTTAGFMTTGRMEVSEGKMATHEEVKGSSEGITEVRGHSEMTPDGKFHVKTEYRKNGEWVPGHEVYYQEDSKAEPVFK